jgi:dihydroneopterin aldolase
VAGDDIGSTADYRVLIRTARATVERERFDLLENVADAVAQSVLDVGGVVRATAIVHKPAAARSSDVQGVAAAATAERDA